MIIFGENTKRNMSVTYKKKLPHKILLIFLFSFLLVNCANNNIELAIKKQIELYPKSRLQDIYKNFYHGRLGTEHLITNRDAVVNYIEKELETMDTSYLPLIEYVGWDSNFVRVNLLYLKQNGIAPEILVDAFIESANYADKPKNWVKEWKHIIRIIEKENIKLENYDEDKKNIDSFLKINPSAAIHHSNEFREAYKPHYRIVAVPLLHRLKK